MPQIHLGVYLTSGQETVNAVRWALEVRSASSIASASLTTKIQRLDTERKVID